MKNKNREKLINFVFVFFSLLIFDEKVCWKTNEREVKLFY